jgi:hypothetical protein
LKGAHISTEIYIGDGELRCIVTIKSREELIRAWLASGTSTEVFLHFGNQFAEVKRL